MEVVCNQENTTYVRKVSCNALRKVVDKNVKTQVVNKLAVVARGEIINDQGIRVQNPNIAYDVMLGSIYVLGATQKKAAIKVLFEIAYDKTIHDFIRAVAFRSIGISEDKTSALRLAKELPQHNWRIQIAIVEALDQLNNAEVKELLDPMLPQREAIDPGVRSDLAKLVDKWSYKREPKSKG